jgi:hypothetical protein
MWAKISTHKITRASLMNQADHANGRFLNSTAKILARASDINTPMKYTPPRNTWKGLTELGPELIFEEVIPKRACKLY